MSTCYALDTKTVHWFGCYVASHADALRFHAFLPHVGEERVTKPLERLRGRLVIMVIFLFTAHHFDWQLTIFGQKSWRHFRFFISSSSLHQSEASKIQHGRLFSLSPPISNKRSKRYISYYMILLSRDEAWHVFSTSLAQQIGFMTCRLLRFMTTQWRHKATILNLNREHAVIQLTMTTSKNIWICSKKHIWLKQPQKVKDYLLLTNEGEKTEKKTE